METGERWTNICWAAEGRVCPLRTAENTVWANAGPTKCHAKPFSKDNNPTKTTTNKGLPKLTLFSASDLEGIHVPGLRRTGWGVWSDFRRAAPACWRSPVVSSQRVPSSPREARVSR